jgi:acyl-CoA synthetase (NDP forming)
VEEIIMDLKKVFKPKSTAIVGVSDRNGSFGKFVAMYSLKGSDTDKLYFVHPKREELMGKRCYPSLDALPEVVDCVVLCTPSATINGLLEEAGKLGIKGAIVFASGFSEERGEEGKELEKELVKIAQKYDMALIGPNCLGLINNVDNKIYWGVESYFEFNDKRGVGVVGQSGFIIKYLSEAGFGMTYMASTGNGNVVTIEDVLDFYAQDDDVRVIALYLEGVKKPEVFIAALKKAAQMRKPVVILKSGRSKKGAAATASHTGNLSGSGQVYDAVFEKFGVVVVDDFVDLIAMTRMFTILDGRLPHKPTLASLNLSGGETAVCADLSEKYGLVHPEFDDNIKEVLLELLPHFATPNNPLDATTGIMYNIEANKRIYKAMLDSDDIGIVTTGINVEEHSSDVIDVQIEAVCAAAKDGELTKPLIVLSSFESGRNPQQIRKLEDHGIFMLTGGEKGYKQIALLNKFAEFDYKKSTLDLAYPKKREHARQTAALSEFDSKEEIKKYGISIPAQAIVTSPQELSDMLKKDFTYPVVLKVNSADILHKTEAGGVKLNVNTADDALKAYDEILTSCKAYDPDARIDGILVQEMVPKGMEIIIGINNDALFGPIILVGLGGIFVEIFKDVVLYPAPVNNDEAHAMLKKLKAYKLLSGYRGSKALDIDALADLIVKVGDYAVANKDNLKELDLNPVFVYEKGIKAVDALIVKYK